MALLVMQQAALPSGLCQRTAVAWAAVTPCFTRHRKSAMPCALCLSLAAGEQSSSCCDHLLCGFSAYPSGTRIPMRALTPLL